MTGNYFAVIGAGMLLGRPLLPDDTPAPGARAVVVLSYEAWRTHFASDPEVVGREIALSGRSFTVVGVTKPGQLLPGNDNGFWAPLTMASALQAADPWQGAHPTLSVVGQVRAGGTQAQLHAWFDTWLRQRFPSESEGAARRIEVASLATRIPQNRATIILFSVLVSGFALVLLVACANVMKMMPACGLSRQRELGVRLSLGATRARLVRQLVTKSLVLALPAAAIGLGFTLLTARVFPVLLLGMLPQGTHVSSLYIAPLDPDARVLALLAIAAIAGAIFVGLSPALQVARANLVLATRGELGPETRISRLRTALVGADRCGGARPRRRDGTCRRSGPHGQRRHRPRLRPRHRSPSRGRSSPGDRRTPGSASRDRARGGGIARAAHRRASPDSRRALRIGAADRTNGDLHGGFTGIFSAAGNRRDTGAPVHRDRSHGRRGGRRQPRRRAAFLARSRSHWPDPRDQTRCRVVFAAAGADSSPCHRRSGRRRSGQPVGRDAGRVPVFPGRHRRGAAAVAVGSRTRRRRGDERSHPLPDGRCVPERGL